MSFARWSLKTHDDVPDSGRGSRKIYHDSNHYQFGVDVVGIGE
jgi:hypothetical protein